MNFGLAQHFDIPWINIIEVVFAFLFIGLILDLLIDGIVYILELLEGLFYIAKEFGDYNLFLVNTALHKAFADLVNMDFL